MPLIPFSQSYAGMTPAIQSFWDAFMDGRVYTDNNPVTIWAFYNCVINEKANCFMLYKTQAADRIDPAVASVMSFGGWDKIPINTEPLQVSDMVFLPK